MWIGGNQGALPLGLQLLSEKMCSDLGEKQAGGSMAPSSRAELLVWHWVGVFWAYKGSSGGCLVCRYHLRSR